MATNIELVQQLYVAYFNRPGDVFGVNFYAGVLENNLATFDAIAADFAKSAEYQNQFAGKVPEAIIDIVYMNMFGRHAEKAALDFYGPLIANKTITIDKVVLDIVSGAQGTDLTAYESKVAAATAFTNFLDTAGNEQARVAYNSGTGNVLQIARDYLNEVTDVASLEAAVAGLGDTGNELTGELNVGKTIVLTKGVDGGAAFLGGAGNDTFVGTVETTDSTYSALDTIDGGSGVDTLKIASTVDFKLAAGATITNVEKVDIVSAGKIGTADGAAAFDTTNGIDFSSQLASVGELTLSKASQVEVKVASTTAVTVADITGGVEVVGGKSQTVTLAENGADTYLSGSKGAVAVTVGEQTNDIFVDGGTTVTVNATASAANGDIVVGDNTAATGAVSVTSNLNSDGSALAGGDIYVEGGTTVNVTVNASSVAEDETAAGTLAVGNIDVLGNGKTTSVTVTQNVTEETFTKASVAVKKETSVVTFGAMKSGETLTINGLTFTASKDLTAEQAAAAFANLTKADTQTATGPVTNGIYSGTFNAAVWTSGAVSGKTVTFTANDEDEADLTFTGTSTVNDAAARIPTQVKTTGTAKVAAIESGNTVAYGTVTIDDNATAAITTVKVDGYTTVNIGQTVALDKLSSLTLANGDGAVVVDAAATTLDLTLNTVAGTVDLDDTSATVTTLKVHTTGDDSEVAVTAAAVKDLTVDGTELVDLTGSTMGALETVVVTGSAGLTLGAVVAAKSITTTGTTGTVTATIDGNAATYTGGAGVDKVTLNSVTVSKAISLGAGNDTLSLFGGTTALGVEVIGGDGTDTLVMNSADAAGATATNIFETKVTGFEKLSLNATAANATDVVDMANLDDINYVISKNTAASAAATESAVVTFQALTAGQSVTVGGRTVTVTSGASATAADVATVMGGGVVAGLTASGALAGWTAAAAVGANVTFTSTTANSNVTDIVITDAGLAAATAVTAGTTTQGTVGTAEKVDWTVQALTNGQSVTISGVTITALAAMDATAVATAFTNFGGGSTATYSVSGTLLAPGTWTAAAFSNAAGALTLTNGANGDVTDTPTGATVSGAGASPTDATAVTTQGSNGIGNGALTLKNFVANGTVELTDGGSGLTVTMADATGSADSLNIVTKVVSGDLNFGTIAAAGVETIVLTATDIKLDDNSDGVNDAVELSTITLSDAALTKVTVNGNANVDLQLANNVVALATVDASALTGKLTHSTQSTVAETVTGGSAADTLKAMGSAAHKLNGGAGDDVLWTGTGLAQLTGGAGKDVFHVAIASTNVNSASSIMDLGSGDTITFLNTANAFKSGAITLDSTAVFQDFANAAIASITANNNLAWFQFGGNTYIVQEKDITTNNDVFTNNEDFIVKIIGTVDLSTASFNSTSGTLEIA